MNDTYKGESWPKKLARLNFWSRASITPLFFSSPILCLASREAGDISVLKAFGVKPHNIIAVDVCLEAVEAAQALHPDVKVLHADAGDVNPQLPYGAAFLDFCGPVSAEIARVVARVSRKMAQRSFLGVAVLAGREQGLARDFLNPQFSDAYHADKDQRFASALRQQGKTVTLLSPTESLGRDVTISALVEEIEKTVFLFGAGAIRYQSVTPNSRGVPMLITPFIVNKLNRYNLVASRLQIIRRMNVAVHEMVAREINAALSTGHLPDEPPPDPLETIIPADIDDCKREAIRILVQSGANAAQLLNLTKGQAAALRAHGTMGTYA